MSAALALGQPLAGAVVALMYSGGNVLEDLAVARAEHDLRSLVDRAPRVAHRCVDDGIADVPVGEVAVGDRILVRAGEVVPVDGIVTSDAATIDELALTGEAIPVVKARGTGTLSGSLNAGQTFEMAASSVAGESTYAGIVRLVTAAQTAKAPFVRLADRYALLFLPFTLAVAFVAWLISGDLIRSLAVLVAATPCPLILAAPVAFIAGVAQSARRGILVKGGGPLEALARAHTVLFDKTGTLTVGGARLLSIEVAPGEKADEVLMLGASLEQASHHVLASAIVQAAAERGLAIKMPEDVHESMGSGLHGVVEGKRVSAGSRDMILAHQRATEWALRAIRRASWRSALVVFVAVEGRPIGALLLADELRSDTPHAIRMLREAGIARIVMVTGDRAAAAQAIGAALDLDAVLADRVPSDKVDAVRTEQRLNPDHHGRRWHQRCPGFGIGRRGNRTGRARRQRFVRGCGRGDPRGPPRSGRRCDRDRATCAPYRGREYRSGHEPVGPRDAGSGGRLAGAGPGGHRSGSDRRSRDPECVARIEPGPWSRSAEDAGSNRARIASWPRCAHPQPRPAAIDCRCARRCHARERDRADHGSERRRPGACSRARTR